MKTRVNAQTGDNDELLLCRFRDMGFAGVRCESTLPMDASWRNAIDGLAESDWESSNIYLLFGGHMTKHSGGTSSDQGEPWQPDEMPIYAAQRANDLRLRSLGGAGEAIEIGNEPDLAHCRWRSKRHAKELAQVTNRCADEIWTLLPEVTVLCPSVSNLNGRGIGYLDRMLEFLDERIGVAFHRYPAGDSPHIAHKGFATRNHEFDTLKGMTEGRELWCTETGFSNHGKRTEGEQSDYIDVDMRFNNDRGLEHYTVYNINDGYGDDPLSHYGLRHAGESWDGDWKILGQDIPEYISRSA